MKNSSGVFQGVRDVLVENIGVDESEVTMNADLSVDLGMDSLDHVEIIMALEEKFGIVLPDEECDEIKSVEGLVNIVSKYTEQ